MILRIRNINREFDYSENSYYILVIEKGVLLFDILSSFFNHDESSILLLDHGKEMKIDKSILFVDNIYNISPNNKKTILNLYDQTEKQIRVNKNLLHLVEQIRSKLITLASQIELIASTSINYTKSIEINDILGALTLEYKDDDHTFPLNLLNYCKVMKSIYNYKLFVIPNLNLYLTKSELINFLSEAEIFDINFLIISPWSNPFDNQCIVDNDFCIIDNFSNK